MNTFSELSLCSLLQNNLARNGFTKPTPVQSQAIPPALAGHDVVATAQTGTGKTLAFVLPIVELLAKAPRPPGVRAVVLTPTRELAIQIEETFTRLAAGSGIRAATVVGGLNENAQLKAIQNGAQVLVATPGRLCDFLKRKLVKLGSVRLLVLDEADRMLDVGFLPAIQFITRAMPIERQNLFFSATIEASVAHLIDANCRNPIRVSIGSPTKPHEDIELHVYEVEQDRKLGLLHLMLKEGRGSYLVFARTKHGADRLAKKLVKGGAKATSIHGDHSQNQRNKALQSFQQGHHRVLVATDVAARGIHVEGIAHVVNYDLPQAPGDFVHRVGRTGRAGAHGTASTFATRAERSEVQNIERTLRIRLTRREVSPEVPREAPKEQKQMAPVIVMPAASRQPEFEQAHAPFNGKRVRSYAFRTKRLGGR